MCVGAFLRSSSVQSVHLLARLSLDILLQFPHRLYVIFLYFDTSAVLKGYLLHLLASFRLDSLLQSFHIDGFCKPVIFDA